MTAFYTRLAAPTIKLKITDAGSNAKHFPFNFVTIVSVLPSNVVFNIIIHAIKSSI